MPPTPNQPSDSNASRFSPFARRAERVLGTSAAEPEESFDALADLFLGEVQGGPAKQHATAAPIAPAKPVLRLTTEIDDEEDAVSSVPVLVPSAPAVQHAAPAAPVASSPVAVAPPPAPAPTSAVRIADHAPVQHDKPPSHPEPMPNAVVELLVLGNLPVLASAWASQYAREISAAAKRPVASVRVQGGFATVDLIGEWPGGSGPVSSTLHERLEDALAAAACLTDRWIIRCGSGAESPLLFSPLVRVVTVLTGVDEMARAAASNTVKTLAPALSEPRDEEGPSLRIAVIGTSEEESRAVGQSLSAAAEQLVLRPVQHVSCSSKIRSTRSPVGLFSGATEHSASEVLAIIERIVGRPSEIETKPVAVVPEMPAETHAPARAEFERVASLVAGDVEPAPHADASPTQFIPAAPIGPEQVSRNPDAESIQELPLEEPAVEEAATAPLVAPTTPAPVAEPKPVAMPAVTHAEIGSLAAHIAGLHAVSFTCPYAPAVQIALDEQRTIHLLARAEDAASEEATLSALMVASSWAESHATILAAAGVAIDALRRPVMHLLTDAPKRSRRLLETNLRIHLLAPVTVNGETGWFCTELN